MDGADGLVEGEGIGQFLVLVVGSPGNVVEEVILEAAIKVESKAETVAGPPQSTGIRRNVVVDVEGTALPGFDATPVVGGQQSMLHPIMVNQVAAKGNVSTGIWRFASEEKQSGSIGAVEYG